MPRILTLTLNPALDVSKSWTTPGQVGWIVPTDDGLFAVGLLAVAAGPPWREKVLEFLFGKREPADGRP